MIPNLLSALSISLLGIYKLITSQLIYHLFNCFLIAIPNSKQIAINDFYTNYKKQAYYVDPISGNDQNSGTEKKSPWKSFKKLNKLLLHEGSRIEILRPGVFYESLIVRAKGTRSAPVHVIFAPGLYDFYPDDALKLPLHISNTNVKPYQPKALAIFIDNSSYTIVRGYNAVLRFRGKMIETYINNSVNVLVQGLTYDYFRPTVSELKVISTQNKFADLKVHQDSKYVIKDSTLIWKGEGWVNEAGYLWQQLDIKKNMVNRLSMDMSKLKFMSLGGDYIRVFYKENPGFEKNCIYQNRETERDCAGLFVQQSKDIGLEDLRINFMHGMGIVSQLSENIKIKNISVKPAVNSGRTCAAWADILHFSGCRGQINIENSYLSAANDDAINVHGTYLKVVEINRPDKIKLQFMHPETYGFNPYLQNDSIEFVKQSTLLPHHINVVSASRMLNDRQVEVVLKKAVSNSVAISDYVENISATPSVNILNNTITRIPTRGILVTTRRKVTIQYNTIENTYMSGVLVSDDASSWYESGRVLNLSIDHNQFNYCGEPVINIAPENTAVAQEAVHRNISIKNNKFKLFGSKLLFAKSTSNLSITKNVVKKIGHLASFKNLVEFEEVENVKLSGNKVKKN